MDDLLRVIAVLALVAGNAFFVISEYAVITARRRALRPRAEAGSTRARAALRLMDDPVRVISTVQVGITAIGILTGAIGEPLVRDLLGGDIPDWLGFVIAFSVVTYLSVVFGELVPKALTLERAEWLAMAVARPVEAISVALHPAVWVLQGSAGLLLRPFGIAGVRAGEGVQSADELRALVDEAEGTGVIPRSQEELLHNVFELAELQVRDVMLPAHSVAWLDAELRPAAALDEVIAAPHERYPVGRGSLDHLVGVVNVHDVIAAERAGRDATVADLARPALVVPESKDLGALLREQREQRQQLAVVVDEYGATAGIVSIEDVIEELVGEIESEYDPPDSTLTRVDERTVEVSGAMTVDDFNEAVGTRLSQEGVHTLAGLVFSALGRRPRVGDAVAVHSVTLRVEKIDRLRIDRIRAELPAPRQADSERAE